MCQPVSRQSRFSLIFIVQQEPEPEPEPEPRARIRFRFFLGRNDTVPAVPVPAPVPKQCIYCKTKSTRVSTPNNTFLRGPPQLEGEGCSVQSPFLYCSRQLGTNSEE
jgi:hypothetical protein